MSGLNRFFRWFQPDKPEQQPQARIVWSSEPPTPMESVHLPLPTPYSILAEAEAIAADAYQRAWGKPAPLAKTQPLVQRADTRDADALRNAAAGRGPAADTSVIFTADSLPLMVSPMGPDDLWKHAARVAIQDAFAAMPQPQRDRFRRMRATVPAERLSVQLTIAHPLAWDGMKSLKSQLAPHLAGVAVEVLDLPLSLIAECAEDHNAVALHTAVNGTGWWSVCIRVDGDGRDDCERMAA
jgi:hypothetical protein